MSASNRPQSPKLQGLLHRAAVAALPDLLKPALSSPHLPQPASPPIIAKRTQLARDLDPLIRATQDRTLSKAEFADMQDRVLAHPLEPAQTRHNLPKPASHAPVQNEPTAPPAPPATPLPPRQLRAAHLLIAGRTVRAVAADLGVNPHTVSEWKKHPNFRAEVDRLVRG